MSNLILVGFSRSGKTTWGRELSQNLGYQFLDVDEKISEDCSAFYQRYGASLFRQREKEVIRSLLSLKNTVISSGGGSVLDADNCACFKSLGKVVYIYVAKQELYQRQLQEPLPAFLDRRDLALSFETMYKERAFLYERIADFIVSTKEELWQAIHLEPSFGSPPGASLTGERLASSLMDVQQA